MDKIIEFKKKDAIELTSEDAGAILAYFRHIYGTKKLVNVLLNEFAPGEKREKFIQFIRKEVLDN